LTATVEVLTRGLSFPTSLALDETGAETVARFAKRRGLNYPILMGDQKTFQRFKGYGIPYTLVLDREGRIVSIYRGPVTRQELESDLADI